ncbi:MAG TPA: hypothetical protein PKA58_29085 [Polyangium sp.]|nr:hypothetical protein [Polyangium sp.]
MSSAIVTLDTLEMDWWLHELGVAPSKMGPTMAVVAETLVSAVDDNLETSGHGTFPPLAASTLRQKARKGWSSKPLFATGAMAAANAAESGDDYAEVTNSRSYTIFHVADGPRKHLPKRDFFELQQETYEECTEIVVRGLLQQLG